MKNWIKALLSEAVFSLWWILSAFSTASSFFVSRLSGKPRLVFAVSAVVGFAWANLRVFQKQESRISGLQASLASQQARISQLTIIPAGGSRYILSPLGNIVHAAFNGSLLEFHLRIENRGRKNSIVSSYQVEITDLHKTFQDLQPQEGRNSAQGRHCVHGLQPAQILSRTGIVRIEAEGATDHGTLLFFIPDITMESFVDAGLKMSGPQHKFGTLRCRLTIADTTGSSTNAEFELHED